MKRLLAPLLMIVLSTLGAAGEDFESYATNQSLTELPGWSALPANPEGSASAQPAISETQSASGTKALEIPAGASATHGEALQTAVQFHDIYILPVFGAREEVMSLAGARIGFVREENGGRLVIYSGAGDSGTTLPGAPFAITADGSSEEWIRLTVRAAKSPSSDSMKWDLTVNGRPAVANQSSAVPAATLNVQGPAAGSLFIDDVAQSAENPLFADSDRDGMPDAEEKANGLNPFGDDREGDLDGDGISNINEFYGGSSPQVPGSLSAPAIFYVDNLAGNDANTGARSYVAIGNDGPKASIKAAMAAAPGGSTIVVLKGRGSYEEGSRGIEGKPLTIKTVEPVTIK